MLWTSPRPRMICCLMPSAICCRKGIARSRTTLPQYINRLFQKHLKGMPAIAANPPWLTSQNTLVTQETRSKQKFAKLTNPVGGARDCEHPIVIVRYRGVDCLLDGHHRGRAWLASADVSEHTAYVLIV